MNEESKKQIKQILENSIKLMGLSFETIDIDESGHSPKFVVKTGDSAMLIGVKGANLLALNHVVKRIISKGVESDDPSLKFFVDVNNYHEKAEEDLKNRAKIMADRAKSFKVNVELEPMSSYERMVVHSFLEGMSEIKTESVGVGKNRRVVIKYTEREAET